jgi:outer membrane protein TolC
LWPPIFDKPESGLFHPNGSAGGLHYLRVPAACRAASKDGPAILWVRIGNASNRTLIDLALRALPTIVDAVERDEAVIEFVAR